MPMNLTVKYSRLVQWPVIKIISLTLQVNGRNWRIRLQWQDKIKIFTDTSQSGLFNIIKKYRFNLSVL